MHRNNYSIFLFCPNWWPLCRLPAATFLIQHPPPFSLRVVWTRLHFGLYPFLLPGVLLSVLRPPHNASCGVMARHGVGRHECHLVSNVLQSERLVRVNQVVQWSLAKSAGGEAFLYHGQLQRDWWTKKTNLNSHLAPPKLTIQHLCQFNKISFWESESIWSAKSYLRFLVVWPASRQWRETMPTCFRTSYEFRVAVKVFINRQRSLLVPAMTCLNYNHHNTVELLICDAPPGVVSFITKAWAGRVIDIVWLTIRGYCSSWQELWCCWHIWPFTRIS